MLKLIRLEEKYAAQLNDMMDEWTASGEKIVPWAITRCDYHDLPNYIKSLENKEADEKYVPDSTYFCLDTDRNMFVGAVNIRHYLNEHLLSFGGHIGDGIRPSERGKGCGTRMIALALEECDRLGISRILMCCDKDNIASARTIVKNGGVLENEIPEDGNIVQRYWIERLKFVLPSEESRADVLNFYNEFERANETCIGYGGYKDFDKWLVGMNNRHTGKNLPDGYVRENFYLCYSEDKLVGVFNLKFELTEFLLNFGGHIGYAVCSSERNRGLATQMLRQGIGIAKQFGFDRILCVCDEDNYASEKVIIKNGGVLENMLYDPEEKATVKRYWIEI